MNQDDFNPFYREYRPYIDMGPVLLSVPLNHYHSLSNGCPNNISSRMIDPYSLKKAKEDEEDKMLKEVRLPIGQVQTDIPLTCLLFKEYVPRNDQLKNR